MTKQELINALNDTEAERVRWMTAALTAGNEIAALKAQVNRFREILSNIDKDNYDEPTFVIQDALSLTADHCLAEVKAKAIEEALLNTEAIGSNGHDYDYDGAELQKYADMLRGQVTVSDQLDLATKIMTVTI